MFAQASRYFHTLRYLRPSQIAHQVVHRVRRAKLDLSPPPAFAPRADTWIMPARREPSMEGVGLFRFLGEAGSYRDIGWSGDEMPLLWRYNQHYFDDLNAADAPSRDAWQRSAIADWLAQNAPGSAPGYDPYTTSLRLVNWAKWLLGGAEPVDGMQASMAVQARLLMQRLEYHVRGNHLLSNGKALVFAGALFTGDEADRWLRRGLAILRKELPEQVLGDGGNYERSTMYHALCFEDVLDLINLARARPGRIPRELTETMRQMAGPMRFWLDTMCHPDGEIAHFNDAAIGIAPSPAELRRYADALKVEARPGRDVERVAGQAVWLRASGYVRVERDNAVLLCDLAPLGPDYLPAHGHADTLSFELSVHGQRLVVNGGTSRYGVGPERHAERGTGAHSTVQVSGEDSSEVWGGFRVARRAKPFDLVVRESEGVIEVAGSHDGYARLPEKPIHRRSWSMGERRLEITDSVAPQAPAIAQFVIHPDQAVERAAQGDFATEQARFDVAEGNARTAPAAHSPRFGDRRDTVALAVELVGGQSRVLITW